jgi:hypothetical protein
MPGPAINADDKPVLDEFGIPVACVSGDECCDPCDAWLNCLKRTPLKLDLAGFDFADWLAWIQMTAIAYQDQNLAVFSGEGGDNEWNGTFLALPRPGGIGSCRSDAAALCGTHALPTGRSILTPNSTIAPIDEFSLHVDVECVLNDEDQKCVKFTVYLLFRHEPCRLGTVNDEQCLPVQEGPVEPLPVGWEHGDPVSLIPVDPDLRSVGCCPLLASDLIPLDGLTWGDLQDIALLPVPPGVVIPNEAEPPAECHMGDCASCGFPLVHKVSQFEARDCVGLETPVGPTCVDCGALPLAVVNECPPNSAGTIYGAIYHAQNGLAAYCHAEWCCPPPIVKHEGSTLSVLAESCTLPTDCSYCARSPSDPPNRPATRVEISFTATPPNNRCKTLTAIVPDCLKTGEGEALGTNLLYYWSTGQTGPVVSYCLKNVDPEDVTEFQEFIHLTVVNLDTGCIYCYGQEVTANCCDGAVTANVEAEPTENPCEYELHVTGSNTSTECFAIVYIWNTCLFDGPTTAPTCSPCFDEDCETSGVEIAPGGTVDVSTGVFTVDHPSGACKVYWQVWDAACGCPGPMNVIELFCSPCDCCNGAIGGALMSITGIPATGTQEPPCTNCDDLNLTDVDVPASVGGECLSDVAFGEVEVLITCPGPSSDNATVNLAWSIECDLPGEPGYWLRIVWSIDEPFGGAGSAGDEYIFLGLDKPTCATISECYPFTSPPTELGLCNYENVTVCAEFYA